MRTARALVVSATIATTFAACSSTAPSMPPSGQPVIGQPTRTLPPADQPMAVEMANLGLVMDLPPGWIPVELLADEQKASITERDAQLATVVSNSGLFARARGPSGFVGVIAFNPDQLGSLLVTAEYREDGATAESTLGTDLAVQGLFDDSLEPPEFQSHRLLGGLASSATYRFGEPGIGTRSLRYLVPWQDDWFVNIWFTLREDQQPDVDGLRTWAESLRPGAEPPTGHPRRDEPDAVLEGRLPREIGGVELRVFSSDRDGLDFGGYMAAGSPFRRATRTVPELMLDPGRLRGAALSPAAADSDPWVEVYAMRVDGFDAPTWYPLLSSFGTAGWDAYGLNGHEFVAQDINRDGEPAVAAAAFADDLAFVIYASDVDTMVAALDVLQPVPQQSPSPAAQVGG